MRIGHRIARSMGWVAAAGLLALLVSTNCGPVVVAAIVACTAGSGGGGGGSTDADCELGNACDTGSGRCSPITCTDGDLSVCPIGTTCAPDKGAGVCKPAEQFTCDPGQTCSPFPVRAAVGTTVSCGCVPR